MHDTHPCDCMLFWIFGVWKFGGIALKIDGWREVWSLSGVHAKSVLLDLQEIIISSHGIGIDYTMTLLAHAALI